MAFQKGEYVQFVKDVDELGKDRARRHKIVEVLPSSGTSAEMVKCDDIGGYFEATSFVAVPKGTGCGAGCTV